MKKLEYFLYSITSFCVLVSIYMKSRHWDLCGPWTTLTMLLLSFVFMVISWFVYSTKDKKNKTNYFVYGTIPLGLGIASLLIGFMSNILYWELPIIKMPIGIFMLCLFIFFIDYKKSENIIRKKYLIRLIITSIIFLALGLFIYSINIPKYFGAVSLQ